jgi:hypothetical protein
MDSIKNAASNAAGSVQEGANATSEYAKQAVTGSERKVQEDKAKDSSQPISERVSSGASALKNAGKEQGHETKGDSHNPLN